jgi:hypothetical protein
MDEIARHKDGEHREDEPDFRQRSLGESDPGAEPTRATGPDCRLLIIHRSRHPRTGDQNSPEPEEQADHCPDGSTGQREAAGADALRAEERCRW